MSITFVDVVLMAEEEAGRRMLVRRPLLSPLVLTFVLLGWLVVW